MIENTWKASNLLNLKSEVLSDELFVDVMMSKSDSASPFTGHINEKPWLTRVIEAEQTLVLSYLFQNKKEDICNLIRKSGKDVMESYISSSLISLLLEKSDNYRMLRREFFMILISVYGCDKSIAYVKMHSKDTSIVSLKAVNELKDLFAFTNVQKFKLTTFVTTVCNDINLRVQS